jgi:hypothetical protein
MCSQRHAPDEQLDAASWCRHLIPQGSVYAFLADHRRQLFPPELFADVARQGGGHASVPAEVIATARPTVYAGVRELDAPSDPRGRIRRPGGGPKRLAERDPGPAARI